VRHVCSWGTLLVEDVFCENDCFSWVQKIMPNLFYCDVEHSGRIYNSKIRLRRLFVCWFMRDSFQIYCQFLCFSKRAVNTLQKMKNYVFPKKAGRLSLIPGRVIRNTWKAVLTFCPASCWMLMDEYKVTVQATLCNDSPPVQHSMRSSHVVHGASKRKSAPQTTCESWHFEQNSHERINESKLNILLSAV